MVFKLKILLDLYVLYIDKLWIKYKILANFVKLFQNISKSKKHSYCQKLSKAILMSKMKKLTLHMAVKIFL